jgi:hypothetical protein
VRVDATGNQCGHPPQRGLLPREHAELTRTCREHPLRLTQPVALAMVVRHVASGPVEQTVTIRRDIPLQPYLGAVTADASVLELADTVAAGEFLSRFVRPIVIVRMDEVEKRPRQELVGEYPRVRSKAGLTRSPAWLVIAALRLCASAHSVTARTRRT